MLYRKICSPGERDQPGPGTGTCFRNVRKRQVIWAAEMDTKWNTEMDTEMHPSTSPSLGAHPWEKSCILPWPLYWKPSVPARGTMTTSDSTLCSFFCPLWLISGEDCSERLSQHVAPSGWAERLSSSVFGAEAACSRLSTDKEVATCRLVWPAAADCRRTVPRPGEGAENGPADDLLVGTAAGP